MSVFEFYTFLLSFVVSLGVASLLSAIARLVQEAGRVKLSWSYALWTIAIFNLMITFWIKSWSYHDTFELRLAHAGPPLLLAIVGYLACGLATPPIPDEGVIDLDAFHERQGPKYMVAITIFMALAIVQGVLMGDFRFDAAEMPWDIIVQVGLGSLALVSAMLLRRRWIQILAPIIFLTSSVFYYLRLIGW
jgi:hypothetical protein